MILVSVHLVVLLLRGTCIVWSVMYLSVIIVVFAIVSMDCGKFLVIALWSEFWFTFMEIRVNSKACESSKDSFIKLSEENDGNKE